jgi:hypothetical protein
MGKASSAKKVARAARAGGNRRSGQRRALGFPVAVGTVIVLGLLLVGFARSERNSNARPRVNAGAAGVNGDHWHVPYSLYTCVTDPSTPASTTTTTTTTTAPTGESTTTTTTTTTAPTSTTVAADGNVPGQFQPHPNDAFSDALGIHSHGDGVIHVHPFSESVSGQRATLDKFFNQIGASISNDTLVLPTADGGQLTFKEGETKCEGGKDAIVQVARWDTAQSAANGDKPNEIITSNMGSIRLRNGQAMTIAFLPAGSTIPIERDVETRLEKLTDVASGTTTTNPQSQSSGATESSSAESSSTGSATTGSESTSASSSTSSSSP